MLARVVIGVSMIEKYGWLSCLASSSISSLGTIIKLFDFKLS
jgi:hypothetical protein